MFIAPVRSATYYRKTGAVPVIKEVGQLCRARPTAGISNRSDRIAGPNAAARLLWRERSQLDWPNTRGDDVATMLLAVLAIATALLGPIFIPPIERNLEVFFLLIGVLTACLMGQFNMAVVKGALREPLSFTLAVLVFGAAFKLLRGSMDQLLTRLSAAVDPRRICLGLTIVLGFSAALTTPVVSALIFVEAISLLRLGRQAEIAATVLACFAIGIGAGVTPLGMPGIAVVLRSLHADFWYLTRLLGPFVAAGVVLTAIPSLFLPLNSAEPLHATAREEAWRLVLFIRPSKVYVFIAGLVALSDALRPAVDRFVPRIPSGLLFWLSTVSAVVNNSTLAVVEIGPTLSVDQQRAALLGLLISGGMLISGNIANIVAASRLGITSREWASVGLRVGIVMLLLCFAATSLLSGTR
jgi:predicted cation transporter